ncbi:MAG: hypothetical protein LQ350_006487 [Teloschistes chrysophthalmus]|nr:MAG: hypothetical protein LQ350_006487 [Niorma chrysophthalma]
MCGATSKVQCRHQSKEKKVLARMPQATAKYPMTVAAKANDVPMPPIFVAAPLNGVIPGGTGGAPVGAAAPDPLGTTPPLEPGMGYGATDAEVLNEDMGVVAAVVTASALVEGADDVVVSGDGAGTSAEVIVEVEVTVLLAMVLVSVMVEVEYDVVVGSAPAPPPSRAASDARGVARSCKVDSQQEVLLLRGFGDLRGRCDL